jgi:hypothetical protein
MTFRLVHLGLLTLALLAGAPRASLADVAPRAATARAESVHRLGSDARQLRFEGETSPIPTRFP